MPRNTFTRAFSFNFHSTWIQNSWGMSYTEYIYKAVISLLWGGQEGLPLICVKATHVPLLEKVKVERSVQFSRSVMSDSMQPHGLQHARLPCPSPTPGIYSNSCPLSLWCHWKVVAKPRKTLGFLASRGEEFNPGPEMRLDCSELLYNKFLLQ